MNTEYGILYQESMSKYWEDVNIDQPINDYNVEEEN